MMHASILFLFRAYEANGLLQMISDERLANIEKLVCDSLNDDSAPTKVCEPDTWVETPLIYLFTREESQASTPECMQSK
jgi:hypothetical protein